MNNPNGDEQKGGNNEHIPVFAQMGRVVSFQGKRKIKVFTESKSEYKCGFFKDKRSIVLTPGEIPKSTGMTEGSK